MKLNYQSIILVAALLGPICASNSRTPIVKRVGDSPIIFPELDSSIGSNIQGPSAIRVPDWVENPLGKYYLYFADHKGSYIRLAYANKVEGPWTIHKPGTLQIEDSYFLTEPPEVSEEQAKQIRDYARRNEIKFAHDIVKEVTAPHIASPDVLVDEENQRIVMFFHGLEEVGVQVTRAAVSKDGINFITRAEKLGQTYWRSFKWGNYFYALAMPGQFYRSESLLSGYEEGPLLFNPDMRHNAVMLRGDQLFVFWTQVGEIPESIKLSKINLSENWEDWVQSDHRVVLRPEKDFEGANEPLIPSIRSTAYGKVNQLRDPAILVDNENIWLFYAVAGESGIALGKVKF
jgi:hypothetical protein